MAEIDAYDYELPPELIAQHPLATRSDARLMVVDRGRQSIEHAHVRDLPQCLLPGDCLVINDTRVIPARLVGYRARTGGRWQGLFLDADAQGTWRVISRTRGRLTPGETLVLRDTAGDDAIRLRLLAALPGGTWAVRPEQAGEPLEILEKVGRVPLPPYIRDGEMIDADRERYQTVFATRPGAVAAPTAGLHFTAELMAAFTERGVPVCRVTLHVGIGTFRPVTSERLSEHAMHSERGSLGASALGQLQACRARGGRIVAIGTTSARVLETSAQSGQLCEWEGETDLFIRPPYRFQAVDSLLTNFHLPRSTLLILVRTFGGDNLIEKAYRTAVRERYRFYSYGDAMLIL